MCVDGERLNRPCQIAIAPLHHHPPRDSALEHAPGHSPDERLAQAEAVAETPDSLLAAAVCIGATSPEQAGKKGDHLVGDFYVLFDRKFSEEYQKWQSSAAAQEKLAQ